MKFRKPSSEQKQIYKLAGSLIAMSDGIEAPQAILLARKFIDATKGLPDKQRRRLVFRSVGK